MYKIIGKSQSQPHRKARGHIPLFLMKKTASCLLVCSLCWQWQILCCKGYQTDLPMNLFSSHSLSVECPPNPVPWSGKPCLSARVRKRRTEHWAFKNLPAFVVSSVSLQWGRKHICRPYNFRLQFQQSPSKACTYSQCMKNFSSPPRPLVFFILDEAETHPHHLSGLFSYLLLTVDAAL